MGIRLAQYGRSTGRSRPAPTGGCLDPEARPVGGAHKTPRRANRRRQPHQSPTPPSTSSTPHPTLNERPRRGEQSRVGSVTDSNTRSVSTDPTMASSLSRSTTSRARKLSTPSTIYRKAARVPRGLTPRVNRVSYITHPTVLRSTVATWIKDLNPKQLPSVAWKCDSSQNPRLRRGATGVVGRSGAADPHGRSERSGVNSSRPISGRSRGITFACDGTARFRTCGQNGEAAGLAPAVLHSPSTARPRPRTSSGPPTSSRPTRSASRTQ